ncbi:MAG TPA: hypothetical protein PKL04_00840 [Methanofastidiosum sp.]|nr:hypothetical protein [Methanofastidiosum sp.]
MKLLTKYKYMILILVVIIGLGSVYFYGDDNVVEEISEEIIKQETGIDIDLTPSSPEK